MKRIIIICSILGVLLSCHYSCFNCTGPQYVSCLSCPASSLNVVQDPNAIPQAYWSSVYPTGTCVDTLGGKTNPLGIVLFILLSACLLIGGTKESLYLYLTIQTWGLYNLVEIAWVNPIGYVLQGLQYFMIWSVVGSGYKSTDYSLLTSKYYRMSLYMKQTGLAQNIALIAAFTLLSFVLLIIICIIAIRRKKQASVKEQPLYEMSQRMEEQQQGWTCMEWFSENVLIQVAKFLLVVLFLMAQETSLVLLVSLVFNLSAAAVVVAIVYLHILVFAMSYAYYYRVQYFKEKKVMYVNFAKKVILPIMVVVPIKYHYLLFLFAAITLVIEIIIDCYNGFYKKFTRMAFYKAVEVLIYLLLLTYYLVQSKGTGYSSSKAAAIACTFAIGFFIFMFVAVEFPIAIKQRFFSNKKKGQEVQNPVEDTISDINEKNQPLQLQTLEVVEMSHSNRDSDEHDEKEPKEQEKQTKEGSILAKEPIQRNANEEPKQQPANPEPQKKKRRKQILDKELRMRYGI